MGLTRPELNDISQKSKSVSEICKALIFILLQTVKIFSYTFYTNILLYWLGRLVKYTGCLKKKGEVGSWPHLEALNGLK